MRQLRGGGWGPFWGCRFTAEVLFCDVSADDGGVLRWDHPTDSASSQNVIPVQHHLGAGTKYRILSPTLDILDQKCWW